MPYKWIEAFQQELEKRENYAEKTLAAYRLGMRAGGAIRGVRIQAGKGTCPAAAGLAPGQVYHPDDAPRLPLADCPRGGKCTCVYRPVMSYEASQE